MDRINELTGCCLFCGSSALEPSFLQTQPLVRCKACDFIANATTANDQPVRVKSGQEQAEGTGNFDVDRISNDLADAAYEAAEEAISEARSSIEWAVRAAIDNALAEYGLEKKKRGAA